MAVNLSGIFGDVAGLAGSISLQDIIAQAALGAAVTVGVSGLKTQEGQNALDPLHIFTHPQSGTTGVVTGGNVMTMSAYMALSPTAQEVIRAQHYTITPG
jgi:hypothetical protein